MRTIKFRGKHIKTGEWLYGSHYNDGAEDYILENLPNSALGFENRQIDQNTIGQFTGLQDSKGNDIYEGDIVVATSIRIPYYGKKMTCEIVYDEQMACYDFKTNDRQRNICVSILDVVCEVVGNVFDNSELLKGGEQ